jgi:hypothetical protein
MGQSDYLPVCLVNPLSCIAPYCALLYYFTLSNTRQFYLYLTVKERVLALNGLM